MPLQLLLLVLEELFGCLQRLGLRFEALVGVGQLRLLALQLFGQRLRLLQQLFRSHGGGDGVEHDTHRFGELIEEGEVDIAELVEGCKLDNGFNLSFEHHGQDDDAERGSFAQAARDFDVIVRDVGKDEAFLFESALSYQSFAGVEAVGNGLAFAIRIAREQLHDGFFAFGRVVDIEDALLRVDQRGKLAEHQFADGEQVALALHHGGEARDVGLEPVLIGVLARGLLEVGDHFVDRVLQGRHFALGVEGDGSGQIALGHGGGHFGDGANLGGEVRGQLVHVVGKVAPDAGRAGHARLTAET